MNNRYKILDEDRILCETKHNEATEIMEVKVIQDRQQSRQKKQREKENEGSIAFQIF